MGIITVEQLADFCQIELEKGNGKKKIVVSDDEECNGYHGLFCGFMPTDEVFDESLYSPRCNDMRGEDIADYITLA